MPWRYRLFALLLVITFFGNTFPFTSTAQEEKKQEEKQKFKRRDTSSDEDLRKQLQLVPNVGFDQIAASVLHSNVVKFTAGGGGGGKKGGGGGAGGAVIQPDIGPVFYAQLAKKNRRQDWLALPWRTGQDSALGKESAERLHVFSGNLRTCMRQSVPANDIRPDPDELKRLLIGKEGNLKGRSGKGRPGGEKSLEWTKSECVPTLAQMLQSENTAVRTILIEVLAGIGGKEASVTLAQRAVFDLSPEVREKAVEVLAKRPAKEYQQILLDTLRWPWTPAADHAAEAISALQLKDVVPELVELLKEPDPRLPFTKEKVTLIQEVVRINHLSNCLLCHAASSSKDDLVRGLVPTPGRELAPLYYSAQAGLFVRADITFLRQDFSLVQPVANSGKWPGFQRFDYLLRTRQATPKEVMFLQGLQKEKKLSDPYPQRDAVLFALREITKTDRGSQYESWLPLLNPIEKK
jgi:hypothetical protein